MRDFKKFWKLLQRSSLELLYVDSRYFIEICEHYISIKDVWELIVLDPLQKNALETSLHTF